MSQRAVVIIGLLLIAGFVASLVYLWHTSTYEMWGAMLVGPAIFALSLPALTRQARREQDPRLLWILVAALVVKLLFSLVKYHFAFEVYEKADARRYDDNGAQIAEHLLAGNFDLPPGDRGGGTRFIEVVTGVVYTITRPTVLGGFLVFSWLGFWGLYAFYRAFHLAVPEGRTIRYAALLFFLPSMLYWPSSPGKEAWLLLTLGIGAFGAARMFTGRTWNGLAILAGSLWLAALVRPHYAGLLAIAVGFAYVFRKSKAQWGQRAPIMKGASLVVLIALSGFLVAKTQDYLGVDSLTGFDDVQAVLDETAKRTEQGGSEFTPPRVSAPADAPVAVFTVLFRPSIFEANNGPAAIAALEGTFLAALSLFRWRSLLAAFRIVFRRPYIAFVGAYTAAGIIVLSSVGNFGILTRQRVLVYPAYLALLCIAPSRQGEGVKEEGEALAVEPVA